jgi:hypothetical protein
MNTGRLWGAKIRVAPAKSAVSSARMRVFAPHRRNVLQTARIVVATKTTRIASCGDKPVGAFVHAVPRPRSKALTVRSAPKEIDGARVAARCSMPSGFGGTDPAP